MVENVIWGVLGWCTGILTLMQMQVWRAQHPKKQPMENGETSR